MINKRVKPRKKIRIKGLFPSQLEALELIQRKLNLTVTELIGMALEKINEEKICQENPDLYREVKQLLNKPR